MSKNENGGQTLKATGAWFQLCDLKGRQDQGTTWGISFLPSRELNITATV